MINRAEIEPESTIRLKYNCLIRILEKYEIISDEDLDMILNNISPVRKENLKLKQELAELKQKAIVPKYQVGQTLFRIDFGAIVPFVVNEIYVQINANKSMSIQYFDYVGLVIEENELFATREEAEQKLAEIEEER